MGTESAKVQQAIVIPQICRPRLSQPGDVDRIMSLLDTEKNATGAVFNVSRADVIDWIRRGYSVVTEVEFPSGKVIVAHMGAAEYGTSVVELRSAVVLPEYRKSDI